MYCRHCGSEITDASKFCSICGKPVTKLPKAGGASPTKQNFAPTSNASSTQPASEQVAYQTPPQQAYQEAPQPQAGVPDKPANIRTLAMSFYWGTIISLLIGIAVADRSNPLVKHHLNQGLMLYIFAFLLGLLFYGLFVLILVLSNAEANYLLALFIIALPFLVVFIFMIIGAMDASHGKMRKLPFIGWFQPLK